MSEKCWSFRDWPKTKNGNPWNIDMVGYNSDLVVYGQILPKKKNQIRIRQLLKYPKDQKEIYFNLFRRKKRRECSDLVDQEYENCLLEIVPQSQLDLGCNYPLGKEIKGFRPR